MIEILHTRAPGGVVTTTVQDAETGLPVGTATSVQILGPVPDSIRILVDTAPQKVILEADAQAAPSGDGDDSAPSARKGK